MHKGDPTDSTYGRFISNLTRLAEQSSTFAYLIIIWFNNNSSLTYTKQMSGWNSFILIFINAI